jgi:hypothetical protein
MELEPLRWRDLLQLADVDALLQIAILLFSVPAMILITGDGTLARWGWWLGLASQPFWIAATWRARQWGMLVLAIMYTGLWLRGIVTHFS